MNVPTIHEGKFPIPQNCGAPVAEVISLREWFISAESICKALEEIQRVMESRIAEGSTHEREIDACSEVRKARNLLRSAILLAFEDVWADGGRITTEISKNAVAATRGPDSREWEIHCSDELGFLAGLYGSRLHIHYIAEHPELLPNRHWMFMQAVGASFTHMLSAMSEMTVAAARRGQG